MNRDRLLETLRSSWHPMQVEAFDGAPAEWREALLDVLCVEHEDSIDPHDRANDCADASYFDENPGSFASQISVRRKVVEGEPWTVDDMFYRFLNDAGQTLMLFDLGYSWESGSMQEGMMADLGLDQEDDIMYGELHAWLDHFVV